MKIALLQMCSGISPERNAETIAKAIAEAAEQGANLLFTPEMCGLLDRNRKRAAPHIGTEADDLVLAVACQAAASHHMAVALGSLALLHEGGDGRFTNRSFLINESGEIRARYDKLHLFDVDLATGESWRESAAYVPGTTACVASTPIGALGLSICYDIRFPALYAGLSAAGAQILSIPAAFTVSTGEAHWHILLRARAIENAAWVVAAAQSGTHEDGRATYGHSLVVAPSGQILLDMGEGTGIGYADIDLDAVREARSRIPVLDHRRPIPHINCL